MNPSDNLLEKNMDVKKAKKLLKDNTPFRMTAPGLKKGWSMHTMLEVFETEKCPTGHVGVARVRHEDTGKRYKIPLYMFEEYEGPVSSTRTKPVNKSKSDRTKKSARTKPNRKKTDESKKKSKRTK